MRSPADHPDRVRQIITTIAVIGSILINTLSNFFPIRGQNVGEIANTRFANVLIIPASYAFAIWGLIYLGLIGFVVYQFLPPSQQHPQLKRISYLLVGACIAQAAWIYLFQAFAFWWSVLAMLAILGCLIAIYLILKDSPRSHARTERWLLRYPFSIYMAWISVATIVNVASALYDQAWNGWGLSSETWTVIMLLIATAIPLILLWQRGDVPLSLVFVWAFVAIALKRLSLPLIWGSAAGLALIILIFAALSWQRKWGDRSAAPG